MRAGQLRDRVEVQAATESDDAHGGVDRTWATEATCWASIEPLRGRELLDAQQVSPVVDLRVRMRHYEGLTPAKRLKFGTRVFNVESVASVQRGRELEVLCKEEV